MRKGKNWALSEREPRLHPTTIALRLRQICRSVQESSYLVEKDAISSVAKVKQSVRQFWSASQQSRAGSEDGAAATATLLKAMLPS